MIKIKNSKLNKKEEKLIFNILYEIQDSYLDFYITKDNLRLFIKENVDLLLNATAKGDYIIYDTEEKGILLITGYADKFKRKYLKLIVSDNNVASNLLLMALWDIKEDIYIKLNKLNPLIEILKEFKFEFFAGRGKEALYVRRK